MKAKTFRIITFSVVGFLLAIILAVNIAASVFGSVLIGILSGSSVSSATREAGETLAEQIVREGTVLVKNDDKALPLSPTSETKVNVFGWSSVNWVSSGSGSGRSTNSGTADLTATSIPFLKALEMAGIEYNTDLSDFYKTQGTRNSYAWDTLHGYDYESCRLVEPPISEYPSDVLASAEDFSEVAIVVLSRVSGESTDAPLVQYKGSGTSSTPSATDLTYLDASDEEVALLSYVGETYKKVIVLINATNQMNLNFLRDVDGLDACLVSGGTGDIGAKGIVNVMYGQGMYEKRNVTKEDGTVVEADDPLYEVAVSPSGKLTDTYAYDFRTNSSWANTGNLGVGYYDGATGLYPIGEKNGNFHDEPTFKQVSYLDYVENIYVGYKWYETADKMGFWDSDFAQTTFGIENGYDDVVQFPFGYGMTYTQFSWVMTETPDRAISLSNVNDEMTISVRVKNEGEFPAQEVVELYYTPPYTENGIEKSEVNLLAFAKTPTAVEPGESQVLDLTFTPADMGSYDAYGKKIEGGGWILEKGEYQLSLRTDAHTVKENTNATFTMEVANNIEKYDEESASNIFTDPDKADYGVLIDGSNTGANIKYLTRSDFEGTFPTVANNTDRTRSTKHRDMDQKLKDSNLYDAADATQWANERAGTPMPTLGAKNGYIIFDDSGKVANEIGIELGMDYDDARWDDVLDQLTYSELSNLALHGYVHEEPLASVGKGKTSSYDGPSQIKSFNAGYKTGTGFPNPSILAQTWNTELAKSFGLAIAMESNEVETEGWYAPGANLHRSAFGGRNYEYYSEDPVLTGLMSASTVQGSINGGVYVYVKHIIGYDQETARDSLYCWMTEQALRETYMRPFKIILDEVANAKMTLKETKEEVTVNGTAGLMTSYGRIGSCWAGGSTALLTHLLREEWNYHGAVLTDYSDHQNFMNGDQMVRAGGDLWMDFYTNNGSFGKNNVKDSTQTNAAFVAQLREGAHHVLYTICNAAYVNSIYNQTSDDPVVKKGGDDFPLWTIIGIVDAVVIAGCAVWVVFAILKKDKAVAGTNEPADEAEQDADETETPQEAPTDNDISE